ncbi:MAG: permease [Pseudomonadota bacterium]
MSAYQTSVAAAHGPLSSGPERSTLLWFARHEFRLIWRDFVSLMTGGKPQRTAIVATIIVTFIAGMHWFAGVLIAPAVADGLGKTIPVLLATSGALVMLFSLMFSQAIESVTRAYYARSDLDLILSSPAPSHRLFQVRTLVLCAQTVSLSMLISSPVINVLAFLDGAHWLAAYGVLVALGVLATCLAIGLTLLLFRWVGTQRTRLFAQIMAAVVGAGFVIALQVIGILLGQGYSRFSLFVSDDTVAAMPDISSMVWLPASAVMGQIGTLFWLLGVSSLLLALVASASSRRFADDALAASSHGEVAVASTLFKGFKPSRTVRSGLRRKEWALLKRDPWLMSQTLQQILYLLPPAVLLWMNYGESSGAFYVIVPVVVMAAGQLAGGLAWITISGEDAHELIDTAPVASGTILRAKVEAVFVVIGVILAPFVFAIGVFSIRAAIALALGGAMASASAVMIQLWFRSQANRSLFRRRQVSSRAATICEALVSILWAAAAGVGLLFAPFAIAPIVLILIVLGIALLIRPQREA